MKKNKMLRIASVMLVLALITTCVISGTFAKYVTNGSGGDSARVAAWGVQIDGEGLAFAKSYNSGAVAAGASTTMKVVAPNTNGALAAITVSGTPEVKSKVTLTGTLTITGFGAYFPIIFTVNGETYGLSGTDADNKYDNIAALITAVETAFNSENEYAANANIATSASTVSWAWPFHTSDDKDQADTVLGNAAAAALNNTSEPDAPKITFNVAVKVEQVQ